MTYQETVNWMFTQLPMYQKQGKTAFKKDLTNTLLLANHLNNPQHKFKSIHVAGTNGKGSSSHMLASVLQEAGYKVGLYTSPHLKDFRERIKVNGVEVSKQFVIGFIKRNRSFFEVNPLSFFEMTVGMAFDYFAKQKVDIAIIEVGLGGRLDSTNIITPEVSLITNIGYDHTQFLGNTLPLIASEKAGIIKPNIPVVISETQKEIETVFEDIANQNNSKIFFADQSEIKTYPTDLIGDYQQKNIKGVLKVIEILKQKNYKISNLNIKSGLLNTVLNTGLKGRWQILQNNPKVICDTAHNYEGLKITINQLLKEQYDNLHIVFGVVDDKDLTKIWSLLPKNAKYYICKPDVPRGMSEKKLLSQFLELNFDANSYSSVNEASNAAISQALPTDVVYIGGSTFVVAEIF
ncbi:MULTISPECIES: bifunctional folylpolyglutamate synthase/dihydrofolate synthase [Mesoflavibacter]|uniref:Dihydrofolate synthase/folylpolyglutamate synthase n=1 Tax=Mesoflavibacter profundi TaxID=2708110 RepID=A0ABT4RZP5_9FLAO|nr:MULTISPECIES: folylpolyglutamate synthase/dihydrofolate synthase family protein [Mesoflavibacter]MDA0177277.1 bifunctional folylpolyglutamate synthase/dihydrofolate synthase [Mesoflavibacter profundi]QIJ88196.1 Dihydrofolate synthase / Folylpolyglutamate synthase [Mesoflavibacter sp. HG96]QIJ90924.1 Dihydrofolate synthase / Folylpolyglutamate synthase [Mesoflavibacter sp. HG37]